MSTTLSQLARTVCPHAEVHLDSLGPWNQITVHFACPHCVYAMGMTVQEGLLWGKSPAVVEQMLVNGFAETHGKYTSNPGAPLVVKASKR